MRKFLLLICLSIFVFSGLMAQIKSISWKENTNIYVYEEQYKVLNFDGAYHSEETNYLPQYVFSEKISHDNIEIIFLEGIFSTISDEKMADVAGIESIGNSFQFKYFISYDRKQPVLNINVIPIKYNSTLGVYEKLETFYYFVNDLGEIADAQAKGEPKGHVIGNSKLARGTWYKFYVAEDGFYKITYQQLKDLGIDVDNINPKTLQVFGNGGKMLNERVGAERYNDLNEVPIWVVGEEDGKFNSSDYILFYGSGPDDWRLENDMFMFYRNLYTRKAGYFLTFGQTNGKRITEREAVTGTPSQTVTDFIDYFAHEKATNNPIKSGKKWYGETFDVNTTQSFIFNIPNIITSKNANIYYDAAGRQFSSTTFSVSVENYFNAKSLGVITHSLGGYYAMPAYAKAGFTPSSENITVEMKYSKPSSTSNAWLRCIYINAYRQLSYSSGTLFFRNLSTIFTGSVAEYNISTSASKANIKILDISKPAEPQQVTFTSNQSGITFPFYTDKVYQYVCFDGTGVKSVEFHDGVIANQNIHAKESPDMIIVYKGILKDEVAKLCDYHNSTGLKTYMFDIQEVYNEFSSGVPDLCAIRDMMKMWYAGADAGKEPRYLLLVGGASYDPLDRINPNTNDILIHQAPDLGSGAMNTTTSVCSDEFYGFMDDNEGLFSAADRIDIAVGRIPTTNVEDAKVVIDKILHYANNTVEQFGDWRNVVTLLADDADNKEAHHLNTADNCAKHVETNYKEFSVNKIYSGAYTQVTTAGGQRYPEATADVNARIDNGTLIFAYNGHGGPKQLALEQLVSIADINSWRNYDKLTFFYTGTCSFCVYDDPVSLSAGEMVLLSRKGGAVGMLSTTRVTGGPDFSYSFFNSIFEKDENNKFRNVGDIVREAKNSASPVGHNTRSHAFLGDPAIPLNYPKYNSAVKITKMLVDGAVSDTIKAFSYVEVEGEICDYYGNIMSNYNGAIYPVVRDKSILVSTLGNDGAAIQTFYADNSLIYKGKSSINNGKFKFSFITPKDIAYTYGPAKMSFYFSDDETDGNGYYNQYIVGGNVNAGGGDNKGPDIDLFMNDFSFQNGGYTNESPVLLAKLFDESGINTTGSGIGHDIVGFIDGNMERAYTMNTFYQSDLDSYQSGQITYPLFNLSSGMHKMSIRAWDVFNNSTTEEIEFLVISSDTIYLSGIHNYPNPFSDETTFVISHNQFGKMITATLYITSLNGQLLKTLTRTFTSTGANEHYLIWDGRIDNGSKIGQGLYLYKLVVVGENGNVSNRFGKLIKKT